MPTKMCTKCRETKPLEHFYFKKIGRYESFCRPCCSERARNYQHANAKLVQTRKMQYERKRRKWRAQFAIEYLSTHPCVDCRNIDIRVLEFDHVRGVKRRTVSDLLMRGYAEKTILEEIAKCDVVCTNCHKIRTAKQQNWRRGKWAAKTLPTTI